MFFPGIPPLLYKACRNAANKSFLYKADCLPGNIVGYSEIIPQGYSEIIPQGYSEIIPQGYSEIIPQGYSEIIL